MRSLRSDNPESKGILRIAPELIFPLTQKWVKSGFQVNAHAIGDRANTLILDAYTKVLAEVEGSSDEPDLYTYQSRNELRLRIEHAQILRPSDIERMGRMNILASVQPTHGTWSERLVITAVILSRMYADFFSPNACSGCWYELCRSSPGTWTHPWCLCMEKSSKV